MAKYKLRKNDFIDVSVTAISSDPLEAQIVRLYRIEAMQDIFVHNVKKGDVGGYIKDKGSLSPKGSAWVGGNAKVFSSFDGSAIAPYAVNDMALITDEATLSGKAHIHGEAIVKEHAVVSGSASVFGKSLVGGYAQVLEYAQIHDNAVVTDNARVSGLARVKHNSIVSENAAVQGGATISNSAHVRASSSVGGRAHVGGNLIVEHLTLRQSRGVITQMSELYAENEAANQDVNAISDWAKFPWKLRLSDLLNDVYFCTYLPPLQCNQSPLSTEALLEPINYSENPTVFTCQGEDPITDGNITVYANSMTLLKPNRHRPLRLPEKGLYQVNLTPDAYPLWPSVELNNTARDMLFTKYGKAANAFSRLGFDAIRALNYAKSTTHLAVYTRFDPRFLLGQRDIGAMRKLPMSFAPINFAPNKREVKQFDRTVHAPRFALEQFKDWHFNEVLIALASGQDIPYEVLVEYSSRFSDLSKQDKSKPLMVHVLLDFSGDNPRHAKLRSIVNDALMNRLKSSRPRGLSAADRSRSRLRVVNSPRQLARLNEMVCFLNGSEQMVVIDWRASSLASLEVARALTYGDAIGSGQLVSVAMPIKSNAGVPFITAGEVCERFDIIADNYYAARREVIGLSLA